VERVAETLGTPAEQAPMQPAVPAPAPLPGPVRPTTGEAREPASAERYVREKLLGVGGMGEVHLCRDQRIGRSVAMKIIDKRRATSSEVRGRFLAEARIQGQLQHPSIVPVYDLEKGDSGTLQFTMKRVAGLTLEAIVDGLWDGRSGFERRFPQERLLAVFRRVCQCLEYVHAAGVVHRDLKPGNIMVGDYGEVYLLDWGLAKVNHGEDIELTGPRSVPTRQGQVLGTPGYMAPEQAVDAQQIDGRADVYALGAILFELLTHEPFLKGKNARELIRATQKGSDERASERAPDRDIPPELDDVCLRATSHDPDARFSSVRELREAIDAYLEGERDVDLRQRLAAKHVERAESIAAYARSSQNARHHAQAIGEAGRALALDPDCAAAAQLLVKLLLDPPGKAPEEEESRRAELVNEAQFSGGLAASAYAAFLLIIPLLVWQGVRSWWGMAAIFVPLTAAVGMGLWRRMSRSTGVGLGLLTNLAGSLAIAASSSIAGSLILLPVLTTANTLAFGTSTNLRPRRGLILACGCLAFAVPAILEWVGWMPRVYSFVDGKIVAVSTTLHLSPVSTPIVLVLVTMLAIAAPLLAVWRIRDELEEKRRKLHDRLWHLTQLLPGIVGIDRLNTPGARRRAGLTATR
jgi:tRNA A-37 threonylcarbamoyl transferase component Bud32